MASMQAKTTQQHLLRREILQAGAIGSLGIALPDLLGWHENAARAEPVVTTRSASRDKSIILLFLDGGASQIETFDPKPEATVEYRSIFGAISTAVPGLAFGSQLPLMSKFADRMSIVRSLTHQDSDHGGATHWMKTGHPWPAEFLGKAPVIPQQNPSIGAVVARACGAVHAEFGVPRYIRVLSDHGGYPGDDAVWLGQGYSPFRVHPGTYNTNPMLHDMELSIDRSRLSDRQYLMQQLDRFERRFDLTGSMAGMDDFNRQAFDVVRGSAREAFDLQREEPKIRDKYGPGLGEELLLARRLCEHGAGFVTINNGYWDHHGGIIPGLQTLCPPLDHAVATFIEDVEQRGLSEKILLVITGEFGRTPRINGGPGRDHWAGANCAVFIGGGLKMGQTIGETDGVAAYPVTRAVSPQDYMATLLTFMGIDLDVQFIDPNGRPRYMIENGMPISELF